MRVLLQGRPDLFSVAGGDTVHITETVTGLAAEGVDASLSLELRPAVEDYDLVHVFNLMRADEALIQADNARYGGRPYVVTPLYWNRMESEDRAMARRWPGEQRLRRKVLSHAETVVIGATGEADLLERDFGTGLPCRIAPLGIKEPVTPNPSPFHERFGLFGTDFILCVARIGPHKNQLGLIRALRGLSLTTVFLGQAQDAAYFRLCRREAGERALFPGMVDEGLLWSAYAAARVHALPSWCELPGMASLEAALAGCNVVSTSRGTARSYLGVDAWYCDPENPDSIREAVVAAFRAPRRGRATSRLQAYSWQKAAAAVRSVYEEVLSHRNGG